MEGRFNKNDLVKVQWQYTINHETVEAFNIGDEVFLKSNPEHPMKVLDLCKILNLVYLNCGISLPPQCLLQYKFAGEITNGKYKITIQ